METDFKGFHEVPQFSTHSLQLSSDVSNLHLKIQINFVRLEHMINI